MEITHNNTTTDLSALTPTSPLGGNNDPVREEILAHLSEEDKERLASMDDYHRTKEENRIVAEEKGRRNLLAHRNKMRQNVEKNSDEWFAQRLNEIIPNRTILKLKQPCENVLRWLTMSYRQECAKRGCEFRGGDYLDMILRSVAEWLTLDRKHWGLLLRGLPGVGKTTMALAIRDVLTICAENEKVVMRKAVELGGINTPKELISEAKSANVLIIDDLGLEPTTIKSYGNELSPVTDILYSRYDSMRMTIVTTNLVRTANGDQLSDRYGDRISDRISEMFAKFAYSGKDIPSYRKL